MSRNKDVSESNVSPLEREFTAAVDRSDQDALIGKVIADRYEVRNYLGTGNLGDVFVALDQKKWRVVAIKRLPAAVYETAVSTARISTVTRMIPRLVHPNIARIHELCEFDCECYIVMQFLEGMTLRENMQMMKMANQKFSLREVLHVGQQLFRAIEFIHRQTSHLNIRPENIFLCSDDTVKIMDSGLTQLVSDRRISDCEASPAMSGYLAPEQKNTYQIIDKRTDQFAVSKVLIEMITGAASESPTTCIPILRRAAGRGLASVLMKATAESQSSRFDNIDEFRIALMNKAPGRVRSRRYIRLFIVFLLFASVPAAYQWNYVKRPVIADAVHNKAYAKAAAKFKADAETARDQWKTVSSSIIIATPVQARLADDARETGDTYFESGDNIQATGKYKTAIGLYNSALSFADREINRKEMADRRHDDVLDRKKVYQNLITSTGAPAPEAYALAESAFKRGVSYYQRADYHHAQINYDDADKNYRSAISAVKLYKLNMAELQRVKGAAVKAAETWNTISKAAQLDVPGLRTEAKHEYRRGEILSEDNELEKAIASFKRSKSLYKKAVDELTLVLSHQEAMDKSREELRKLIDAVQTLVKNEYSRNVDCVKASQDDFRRGDDLARQNRYLEALQVFDKASIVLNRELKRLNDQYQPEIYDVQEEAWCNVEVLDQIEQELTNRMIGINDHTRQALMHRLYQFCMDNLFVRSPPIAALTVRLKAAAELIAGGQYALADLAIRQVNSELLRRIEWPVPVERCLHFEQKAVALASDVHQKLGPIGTKLPEVARLLQSGDDLIRRGNEFLTDGEMQKAMQMFKEAGLLFPLVLPQAETELLSFANNNDNKKNRDTAIAALEELLRIAPEQKSAKLLMDRMKLSSTVFFRVSFENGKLAVNGSELPAEPLVDDLNSIFESKHRQWGRNGKVLIFDDIGITVYKRDNSAIIDEIRFYYSSVGEHGWSPRRSYQGEFTINGNRIFPGQSFNTFVSHLVPELAYSGIRVDCYRGVDENRNVHIAQSRETKQIEFIRVGFE